MVLRGGPDVPADFGDDGILLRGAEGSVLGAEDGRTKGESVVGLSSIGFGGDIQSPLSFC